jgi:hypothetical protein
MAHSPLLEHFENRSQALAERGQAILDAQRIAAGFSDHQPMLLQGSELLNQHLLRDAREVPFKFACPLRAVQKNIDDDCLPAPGYDAEAPFNG